MSEQLLQALSGAWDGAVWFATSQRHAVQCYEAFVLYFLHFFYNSFSSLEFYLVLTMVGVYLPPQ